MSDSALCLQHIHVIHQLPSGGYVCVDCGLQFREHHEIVINVGVVSRS